MPMLLKLTWILAAVISLNAQVSVVLNRFPARSPEVEVRNDSSLSLTAFAIRLAPSAKNGADTAPFVFFADAAIETDHLALGCALPLASNQKCSVPVPSGLQDGHRFDLFDPPAVSAAVFADGTTAGDAGLLARLLSRRSSMLQAVELAREVLTDAGKRNVPRGQLIRQFETMADSVDHWYLAPEQRVARSLYQSIGAGLLSLPALPAGSAFPPTAFVEQQNALLNRQRTALLESLPSLGATK